MTGCSGAAGQAKTITLGEVLRAGLPVFRKTHRLPEHHWKVLRALCACHTEGLGGHLYRCQNCGQEHFAPNGCGNRHCPSCQKLQSARWLDRQMELVLPIPYFHVVFTLPHSLNPLIQHNQKGLYDLLFASASATLLEFGRNNLRATLGITAVLHTWSQNLLGHYHLHCVVTGGGLSLEGKRWIARSPKWLFPIRALSMVFRAKFRDGLQNLFAQGRLKFPKAEPALADRMEFGRWLEGICARDWVVFTKRPFAGPKAFLGYLCRYTHRVAISNKRLEKLDLARGTVRFSYKDYAREGRIGSMTLALDQFVRRFILHILPSRFVKMRHYGLLSNRDRTNRIAQARALLAEGCTGATEPALEQTPSIQPVEAPPLVCPYCGQPTLVLVGSIPRPKAVRIYDSS